MESEDEKFDGIFLGLAQQHGGVPELLDSFFSFLGRKTDFFIGGSSQQAKEVLENAFRKHEQRALDLLKKKQRAEEERKRKQTETMKEEKQSRVVEITDEEEKQILAEKQNKQLLHSEIKTQIKSSEEQKDEEQDGKLLPNTGNGSQTEKYRWSQVLSEVEALIPVPSGTKARQLDVIIESSRLKIGFKGNTPIVEGDFHKPVKRDECTWTISDGKEVVLTLVKYNEMEWWSQLLRGEPEISTTKITPENSKMEDLDPETRGVVEKIKFDQMQKQAGLPTSDELQKHELLEKFMKQHPEMDFSKAKFG